MANDSNRPEEPPPPAGNSVLGRLRTLLRWLLDPGSALSARVVHAGVWAFALSLSVKLVLTGRRIVLANLLTPEDFGIFGVVLIVTGLLNQFTVSGFERALVQRQDDIRPFLNSAWTVQVIRGFLLAVVLVISAPWVAAFFDSPQSGPLIRLTAVAVLIGGLKNIGIVHFVKDLQFQKDYVARFTPVVADLVFSIVFAVVVGNYWALAIGLLTRRIFTVAMSYVVHPYRPRLELKAKRIRELARYGKWILGSNILVYLILHLDDIVVGRTLDVAALGLYQMAYSISQLATTELTLVVGRVAFPTYSKVQDDLPRLRLAYTRTVQLIALVSFPLITLLWIVGEELIEVFLGSDWLPMVGAFNALLAWGLIRSLLATTGPLFRATGRPYVATAVQAAQLTVLAALIYPMTVRWGIEGAAWATVLASVVPDAVALVLAFRATRTPLRRLWVFLGLPFVHSAVMLGALVVLDTVLMPTATLGWLFVASAVAVAVYSGVVMVSRRFLGYMSGGLLPRQARVPRYEPEEPQDDD